MNHPRTEILDVVSRKLAPFILLFGLYLVAFGHLSPGGGFQGGVVIASGIILLCLGKGVDKIEPIVPPSKVALIEAVAFLCLLGMGMVGMVTGGFFLENIFPKATAAEIPTVGFIFLLNILIGIKVASGVSMICLHLFKEENSGESPS